MSEPTYRDIVDALDDALFIHDPATGGTLDVNRRACELFGHDRASLLAASIDDLSQPPYGAGIAHEHMRRATKAEGGERVEWRCRRRDGSGFIAEVSLRRAARLLTLHGYEALVAAGPDDARALSDAHPEAIDLLLTDVIMPRGSGLELYEHLRARRAGLRVVFMSGYADDTVLQRGLSPGVHRLIQKPFTPEVLLREVRAALEPATPVG